MGISAKKTRTKTIVASTHVGEVDCPVCDAESFWDASVSALADILNRKKSTINAIDKITLIIFISFQLMI
jgi:hypothetical protein